MSSRALLAVVVLGSLAAGCAGVRDEDEGTSETAVVAGTSAKDERPEVGRIDDCSGTLVAANVVLTASHCFSHRSGALVDVTFTVDRADGSRAYPADFVRTFGDDTGEDDLALVHLRAAVPAEVARPLAIALVAPSRGANVTMYGYGCTERPAPLVPSQPGSVFTSGRAEDKRKASFGWRDASFHACPGDSGGPVVDGRGEIVSVVSAYVRIPEDQGRGFDVFADPIARRADLDRAITELRTR